MSQARLPPKPIDDPNLNIHERTCVDLLLNTEYYRNVTCYREQCHVMHDILVKIHGYSTRMCARILKVDHKTFEKQVLLPVEQRPPGRPTLLNEEEIATIYNEIEELHSKQEFPTIKDIQQMIIEKISKVPSLDVIRRIIKDSNRFKIISGIPMEAARVNVSKSEIDDYFERLSQAVNGVAASLVMNVDEAGEDDYCDLHSYQVVVAQEYEGQTIKIPVRRESKRSTLIHTIAADGTYLKPLLIIPRKTVDSSLIKRLSSSNISIHHQKKGFANTDIIAKWLRDEFFPEIERRRAIERERSGYEGHAVLILDGFSCHKKALDLFNLEEMGVKTVFLAPHSSHLTQPLDLVLFASQKRFTTTGKLTVKLSDQADWIRRIINGVQQSSTSENIISAFESAGIVRTFTKESINTFNTAMPCVHVVKGYARFFKEESASYEIDEWRIPL